MQSGPKCTTPQSRPTGPALGSEVARDDDDEEEEEDVDEEEDVEEDRGDGNSAGTLEDDVVADEGDEGRVPAATKLTLEDVMAARASRWGGVSPLVFMEAAPGPGLK